MQKNTQKKPINMRALKGGSYSLLLCALALVLVVTVNLFVGALPSTYTKIDTSTTGLLNISEETKTLVSAVDTPVTVYLLAQRGTEDATISELLQRYKDLSPHITLKTVDPDTNPAFVTKYTAETLSNNSVIVESALRHYVVDYTDIYVTSYANITQEEYYNYMYYGIMPQGTPYFYGELKLTTAIDYVARASLPTVYLLTGHDEASLTSSIAASFTANNILSAQLSLLGEDGIPTDAAAILLNNPKTDLSEYEAERVRTYLENGGSMILVTDFRYFSGETMPNLASVAALAGMRSEDGILVETDRSGYNTYPTMLLPTLIAGGPTELLASTSVSTMLADAHGIVLTGEGEAETAALLKTTISSYVKKNVNAETAEKEEGDADGPFAVAAYAQLGEGKFVWYSSPYIVSEDLDYYVNGGNSRMFMASVNWMCESESSVSVAAKTMMTEMLVVPASAQGFWTVVLVIILPVAVLGVSFAVWLRRRRR